ncbi:MAG: hypothetical protein QNJ89_04695 [Acidimicrobiia bacterium]|nr:hypothetical protein [Acidimicrobiia bacterium]
MATGIDFSTRRGGVSRTVGGILAFAFPLAMTALALSVGLRRLGDMTDIAASLLATMMFLVAAPTAWIFTVDFIEAGRLLVITSALLTSLPLWYFAGSRLAYYARSWGIWALRYVVLCVVWSALNVVLIVIVGSLAG